MPEVCLFRRARKAHANRLQFCKLGLLCSGPSSPDMAEDTISSFAAAPDILVELLWKWNQLHKDFYTEKRSVKNEHMKTCKIAGCPGGCLKQSYLSKLAKVHLSGSVGLVQAYPVPEYSRWRSCIPAA